MGPAGPQGPKGETGPAGTNGGVTASGQRLRARFIGGADGSKEFVGWFDSQRNEECNYGYAGDGVFRCLPFSSSGYIDGYYKDAACTVKLTGVHTGGSPCGAPLKYGRAPATGNPPACTGGVSLRLVTSTVGPQSVYIVDSANGDCVEIPAAQWMASYALYELGAEVPPTEFVTGAYVVE